MESRNHFKNGAKPKSQMSRDKLKIKDMKPFLYLITILLLLNVQLLYGQKDCSKIVSVSKDEFTGVTTVGTELWQIMGKKGAALFNLATGTDSMPEWLLYMGFVSQENKSYVVFQHKSSISSEVNYVYLKFADETVLKLEIHYTSKSSEDAFGKSYTTTLFEISGENLKLLQEKEIVKMQASFEYQPREAYSTKNIDDKTALKIKNLATCFSEKLSEMDHSIPQSVQHQFNLPRDSSTQKVDYKGLISVENRNKMQLFLNAKEWFAKNFSSFSHNNGLTSESFNAGINFQDSASGKIIGTGIIDLRYNSSGADLSGGVVSFNITIMVKNNRYKYELTDFSHRGYRSTGIHDLGPIEEWTVADHHAFSTQQQIQSYLNQVNEKTLKFIDSLNATMKQENNDNKW
jgi:hypothetical protein